MKTGRRLALTEALLLVLVLAAGTSATVTAARYRQLFRASDRARVALPVLSVNRLDQSADLGFIQPGSTAGFRFAVSNTSAVHGVSEAGFDYTISVQVNGPLPSPFTTTLFWLDTHGEAHACTASQDGTFPGAAPMGTQSMEQHYRLDLALPADTVLTGSLREYQVQLTVTARQRNN